MAEAKYLHQNRLLQNQSMLTCQRIQVLQSNTSFIHFPFNNFRYFLTLFSKFFSSFLHSTCSLSVSHPYLALDGIYHQLWATIPSNSTPIHGLLMGDSERHTGLSPSMILSSKRFTPGTPKRHACYNTRRFGIWAVPASVALTEGILVSFFSSA